MRLTRATTLVSAALLFAAAPIPARAGVSGPPAKAPDIVRVSSVVETDPVAHAGDAADDPAIWVNRQDPSSSLVIGNDKLGALETYDLQGNRVQRISGGGFYGNVDTRGDYVAVSHGGIVVYLVRPATQQLSLATDGSGKIATSGEGLCMYDPGADGLSGGLYVFTVGRGNGLVREYSLKDPDNDGLVAGSLVRSFTLGSEAEGCVADDAAGSFFVSEEDVAVWRYGAEPGDGKARTRVAAVGANLPADAEGLTIAGDYLFASAQTAGNQSFINVYLRTAPYSYVKSVRVVAGSHSDDCDHTDGLAAYAGDLGSRFPRGLLVCQDGNNGAPGTSGNQDFKLVPLQAVTSGS
jgi:3-phytase